jgi:hypothetical protein
MSKAYKVDLNLDVKDINPSSGFIMKEVPKEADPNNPEAEFDGRGFKERTGAEVFAFLVEVAVKGANPNASYDQLKGFRNTVKDITKAGKVGEYIANKTSIDLIKSSIRGNKGWPNSDEMCNILDDMMAKLDGATLIDENPTQAE